MFKSSNNKKGTKRASGNGGAALMEQMGFSIPNFDDPNFGIGDGVGDDDIDDSDLQAELEQLQQGAIGSSKSRSKANQKKSARPTQDLQSFHQDVNKLLNDIDRPVNDDELSGDENELLDELKELAGAMEDEQEDEPVASKPTEAAASSTGIVAELEARLSMYKKALETAKASGEAAKVRRYDRQFKLIQELLQNARAGKPIDPNEIPPAIGGATTTTTTAIVPAPPQPVNISQKAPVQTPSSGPPLQTTAVPSQRVENLVVSTPSTSISPANNSNDTIAHLKALALQAKANGDLTKAKEYMAQIINLQKGATPTPTDSQPAPPIVTPKEISAEVPEDDNGPPPTLPLIAPVPSTILEALQQRYAEFTKRHQDAVNKGESSKARRMDRLKNQYKEAIDATRKGHPYDYSELADLPGFAPIPLQQSKAQPPQPVAAPPPAPVKVSQSAAQLPPIPSQPQQPVVIAEPLHRSATTPSTNLLPDRAAELKKLALQAKQRGDIDAAKKYLLESKALEQTASSAQTLLNPNINPSSGLIVEGYDTIRDDDLTQEIAQSNREVIYRRLTEDLIRQIQLCARNQQAYAHMGGANNLTRAKEFQNLEQRCAQDLERLKQSAKDSSKKPIFHYEKRQMQLIQFNTDLTDDDLEVTIVRGINLQVPSGYSPTGLETYVIIEFPYPAETPPQARTHHAVGSANAEYSHTPHKFSIRRNDTKFRRLMGRKELKLSIYYRAGFFRGDRLLGVAFVKLAPLDEWATIHESVDIYENEHRKKPHGKLEVKIRIRDGLGPNKASELSPQRWLIIDHFEDQSANSKLSPAKSTSISSPSIATLSHLIPTTETISLLALNLAITDTNTETIVDSSIRRNNIPESINDNRRNSQQQTGIQSIQLLKYEADLFAEKIECLEVHLSSDEIVQLRKKHQLLKDQRDQLVKNLRQGGKQAIDEHVRGLEQLLEHFNREEEEYRQNNDKKKADLSLEKKNLIAKEIETLTTPISLLS